MSRRKNISREEVEDLYKAFVKFIILKMEDKKNDKMGFHVKGLCSFLYKKLKISNLKRSHNDPQYKRAEEQLHHWLSGYQRLKFEE